MLILPFEELQVVGTRIYRHSKAIPELMTCRVNDRKEILFKSCLKIFVRIGMNMSRKSCAAWPRNGRRHAVSKFGKAVILKIAI